MSKVLINDEQVFNKIKHIVSVNNNNRKNLSYYVENGSIFADNGKTEFILGGGEQADNDALKELNNEAFTRFDAFYGDKRKTEDTITWATLVDTVIDDFYKKHSFLAYAPVKNTNRKNDEEIITKALELILPEKSISRLEIIEQPKLKNSGKAEMEKIFEVAVKFRFVSGGEPRYVINKFYFYENLEMLSSKLSVMTSQQINKMTEQQLENLESENSQDDVDYSSEKISSESVIKMEEAILSVMKDKNGFQDYLVGSAKMQFDKFVEDAMADGKTELNIDCDRIKLRYIARISVESRDYILKNKNDESIVFFAHMSVGDSLVITCATCGEEVFDSGYGYVYEENGLNKVDLSSPSFAKFNALNAKKHCMTPPERCGDCSRLLCVNNLTTCATCGDTLCCDCTKSEFVGCFESNKTTIYFHNDQKCSAFCDNVVASRPIDKKYTKRCSCCGQRYTTDYFPSDGKLCGLCYPIYSIDKVEASEKQRCKQIYKTHESMLPLNLRHKDNIANESFDLIIFRVQKKTDTAAEKYPFKVYMLNKNALDGKALRLVEINEAYDYKKDIL